MRIKIQTKSYHQKIADEKRQRLYVKVVVFGAVAVILFSLVIYTVFFSSWFKVQSIIVIGADNLDPDEIKSEIEKLITPAGFLNTQQNVLFFDIENASKKLLAFSPVMASIYFERQLPGQIIAKIKERQPMGVWCFKSVSTGQGGGDCAFFDGEGVVWGRTISSSGPYYLLINDDQTRSLIPKELVSAIKIISETLPKLGHPIESIQVRYGLTEDIKVSLLDDWHIFFTTTYSIQEQIDNLKLAISQWSGDFKVQYIDLRIQGRAYYK